MNVLRLCVAVTLWKILCIDSLQSSNQSTSRAVGDKRLFNDAVQMLRVSTTHFEPYMYQDNDGNFYDGIEYKLVKKIAEILNMELSFQSTSKRTDICNNVFLKYE